MYSIDIDIAATEAKLEELRTKKSAHEAALADTTLPMQWLAIKQHEAFCVDHKPETGLCDWSEGDNYPNDPEKCNWTNTAHRKWLGIAHDGVAGARLLGFSITEPE